MEENKNIVDFIDSKINESDQIISNASKHCSNFKIIFLSFCLPVIGTILDIYFTQKDKKCFNQPLFFFTVIGLFLLILIVGFLLNSFFYKIQFRYRKVKTSLEYLKEKILSLDYSIVGKVTFSSINEYVKLIGKTSDYSYGKLRRFRNNIFDSLLFTIPIVIIILFFVISLVCFCKGVNL